jgi:uncharacterized protein (UPF0276 family)
MVGGGPRLAMLDRLRERAPISVHGVGLSLASACRPDAEHLSRLCRLCERVEPFLVSEHLAWSRLGDVCFPDLLPFPRSSAALRCVAENVSIVQEALGRPILIENPALYLTFDGHEWSEVDFLGELARRTGCGLLLDVNNVLVSSTNLQFDAVGYLLQFPADEVAEIHLAGHCQDSQGAQRLLIDSHDAPVAESVWALCETFLRRLDVPPPILIERDDNLPPFSELMEERSRAQRLAQAVHA